MRFEQWHSWSVHHLSMKPVPMFDHSAIKEYASYCSVWPFLSAALCCSHPATGSQEQSSAHLSASPLQGAAGSSGVTSWPLFPDWAAQVPSASPHRTNLQPCYQLCSPVSFKLPIYLAFPVLLFRHCFVQKKNKNKKIKLLNYKQE